MSFTFQVSLMLLYSLTTLFASFHRNGFNWPSYCKHPSSTPYVPWRPSIFVFVKWQTCPNWPCHVLRERERDPYSCTFCMDDLVWIDHVTNGMGQYITSIFVVVLWDKSNGVINGEQHHPRYPCKYTKDIFKVNSPNSLKTPRANIPTLLLRYLLFFMSFVCILQLFSLSFVKKFSWGTSFYVSCKSCIPCWCTMSCILYTP